MPRLYKCSFCGKEIPPAEGRIYVRNDGGILRFCSSKCTRNMMGLKRKPRRQKWVSKLH